MSPSDDFAGRLHVGCSERYVQMFDADGHPGSVWDTDPEPGECGSDEWAAWHARITRDTDGVCGAMDCPICCLLDCGGDADG